MHLSNDQKGVFNIKKGLQCTEQNNKITNVCSVCALFKLIEFAIIAAIFQVVYGKSVRPLVN